MNDLRHIDVAGVHYLCVGRRTVELLPSPDGPLLVRGAAALIDDDHNDLPIERPVVALCRCGTSMRAPWCDGMHKLLQRRDKTVPRVGSR